MVEGYESNLEETDDFFPFCCFRKEFSSVFHYSDKVSFPENLQSVKRDCNMKEY